MPRTFRRATTADLDVVQHHRDAMFLDMGSDPAVVADRSGVSRPWLESALLDGSYVGVLAVAPAHDIGGLREEVLGGVGVTWLDLPPNVHTAIPRRGYLLNLYVEPEHRRLGLARALVQEALAVCGEAGVDEVALHASDAGRGLYEAMGFAPTNEMRISLRTRA